MDHDDPMSPISGVPGPFCSVNCLPRSQLPTLAGWSLAVSDTRDRQSLRKSWMTAEGGLNRFC